MKNTVKILALLLAMLLLFTACVNSGNGDTTDTESSFATDTAETESGTETQSEETTGEDAVRIPPEGEHADLIDLNDSLANGVQAYFASGDRNSFNMSNQNMTMSYSRRAGNDQLVSYIKNTRGISYIENTMDVYVKMMDGSVHYASNSVKNADVNIYRLGYYYYEGLFEFQNFIPAVFEVENEKSINIKRVNGLHDVTSEIIDEGVRITITSDNDPRFAYNDLNINANEKNVLVFTARATGSNKSVSVYFNVNEAGDYNENRKLSFALNNDGEYHTYKLLLNQNVNYEGVLKQLRFDLNGDMGDVLEISNIALGSTDIGDVPTALSISRHFHVYSNKMHHEVQFAVTKETTGIAELGMITKIDADTVAKIIVKDAGGEHNTLDGVNWGSVQCVGFDIKGAGVFGYILPDIAEAGSLYVTFEDGYYIIEQSVVPENNTMIPSEKKTNNANDVHMGQRVYTDESHSFDGLLRETYIERNPISDSLVKVSDSSDGGAYLGYDAMRGIYVFNIETATGFYAPYNTPNKQYKVNFAIRGEKDLDRDVYVMTSGKNGFLECAVLLDEDLMMLPVPIEVIKNFSEPNGERNLYNLDDPTFSEAIFCLSLKANEKYEYTILNLYQNWGKYPLKQLSGIPYTAPFYHLSTGVTETNCILPYDGDGTYSYSFVTTMTDGKDKTFRISADEDFKGWPNEIDPADQVREDLLKVYIDPVELNIAAQEASQSFGGIMLSDDLSYVTFTASGTEGSKEACVLAYQEAEPEESGKYFVIKYRTPAQNSEKLGYIEVFISTVNGGPTAGDYFGFNIVEDGEWHVAVIDLEKLGAKTFKPDENGVYNTKYFRVDVFNTRLPEDVTIDIAYVGMDSDLKAICDVNAEEFEFIDLYKSGSSKNKLNTKTYETDEKYYIHPSSGYTESKAAYGANLDSIAGVSMSSCFSSSKKEMTMLEGYSAKADKTFSVAGWCGVDGGVARYVWSADGGKTWNEFSGEFKKASKAIVEAAQQRCGVTFADFELSKTNGAFQGAGLIADLSAFAGQTVELTFGAIPLSDESTIVLLYHFSNLSVPE